MTDIRWTASLVEERLEEAAGVLKRLPEVTLINIAHVRSCPQSPAASSIPSRLRCRTARQRQVHPQHGKIL